MSRRTYGKQKGNNDGKDNNKNNSSDSNSNNKDNSKDSAGGLGHLFTQQSKSYAQFRPTYPDALYHAILQYGGWSFQERDVAVDVGCGTGQATVALAPYFKRVVGLDPSYKQLEHAVKADNVEYKVGLADKTGMPDSSVTLYCAAQAAHWFDMPKFYAEALRILQPNGVIAVWGYSLCQLDNNEADAALQTHHFETLGPYWEAGRALVDAQYTHINFPNQRRETFSSKIEVTGEFFFGYLNTFSALVTLRDKLKPDAKSDPLVAMQEKFEKAYGKPLADIKLTVTFPMFLVMARKDKT